MVRHIGCVFDILLHAVHELDGGLFHQQLGGGTLHQGSLCGFTSVLPAGVRSVSRQWRYNLVSLRHNKGASDDN